MARPLALTFAALLVAASLGTVFASQVQTSGSWSVSFASKGGNEWWVEVALGGASASQVTKVESMDTGGSWVELTKRSWGNWAASYHVEPGHLVRFRATFPDGTRVESCDFTHPAGVEQCASQPPTSGTFDATFSGVKGGEWWVQVHVTGTEGIRAVDARVNDGAWSALSLKSWGDWAASVHAPNGSLVQFRAASTSGAQDLSGRYRWPDARLVDGDGGNSSGGNGGGSGGSTTPPSTAFNASFRPKAGNEWWVETTVLASKPLARVQARVEDGRDTWHDLTLRSWGAWAGSIHAPSGSLVRFRAEATTREDAVSGLYRWTAATPVSDAEAGVWPREGSYAKYAVNDGEGAPDGSYWGWYELNVSMTYQSGRWEALCEGWEYEYFDWPEPHTNATRILAKSVLEPPMAPRDAAVGAIVGTDSLGECQMLWGRDGGQLTVDEVGPVNATEKGRPIQAQAFQASYEEPECHCSGAGAVWSARVGLVLSWGHGGMASGGGGNLVDTDAPLSDADKPRIAPPHVGWPYEGSFARYAVRLYDNNTVYGGSDGFGNVTFVWREGDWTASCDSIVYAHAGPYQEEANYTQSDQSHMAPPLGPVRIAAGDAVSAGIMGLCWPFPSPPLTAKGTFPEDTTRDGHAFRAKAWWGDEARAPDQDAWWDVATRLVLRWESTSDDATGRLLGHLLDTDAPLASG